MLCGFSAIIQASFLVPDIRHNDALAHHYMFYKIKLCKEAVGLERREEV